MHDFTSNIPEPADDPSLEAVSNPPPDADYPAESSTVDQEEVESEVTVADYPAAPQSRIITGQVYPRSAYHMGRPLTQLRPSSQSSGPKAAIWIVILIGIMAVIFLPVLMDRHKHRKIEQLATAHYATASAHFHAKRFDEAESSARETLKLLPNHANAKKIIDYADVLRERHHKHMETASTSLLAASELVAADNITGGIAAYLAIHDDPSNPKEIIEQAGRELEPLRAATGTLILPDDWPDDAVLSIDGKAHPVGVHEITGIPLESHTLTVTREGFRDPPSLVLNFSGILPVVMPPITWQQVGGQVNLTSEPPGAAVWFMGKDTGLKTPCSFEDVDVGVVSYQLKLPEHDDANVEGELASAGSLDLTATFTESLRFPKAGKQAGERQEFNISPTLRIAFRWCPAGSFIMGGTGPTAKPAEKPARTVRLSKGFWLAETEFTQGQWESLTSLTLTTMAPSGARTSGKGDDYPIYFVSWDKICGDNSRRGGILGKINGFMAKHGSADWVADLPTEAQWEYACRAGTTGAFGTQEPNNAAFERSAWFGANSKRQAHPVGTKEANPWGLKDMHGNVMEWCRDWYQEGYANLPNTDPIGPASGWKIVIRGGSYQSPSALCRSAAREQAYQSQSSAMLGFRLILRPSK